MTRAVAVTVVDPAEALRVIGPNAWGPSSASQSQVGTPTTMGASGVRGVIAIVGLTSRIRSTASWAR